MDHKKKGQKTTHTFRIFLVFGLKPSGDTILEKEVEEAIKNYFSSRRPNITGISIEKKGIIDQRVMEAEITSTIQLNEKGVGFSSTVIKLNGDLLSGSSTLKKGHRAEATVIFL